MLVAIVFHDPNQFIELDIVTVELGVGDHAGHLPLSANLGPTESPLIWMLLCGCRGAS